MADFITKNGMLTEYKGKGVDVVIPDNVTRIEEYAFSDCTNLQSITIPDSVTSIDENAFEGCNHIQTFVLAPNSTNEEQCKMLINGFGTKKLATPFLLGNITTNEVLNKLLKSKLTAKTFRTKYIPKLIEKQETEAFLKLLSFIKKMEPEEIDGYMDLSVEKGAVEITNRLMEYRQKLYTPEKNIQMMEEAFEKEIGIREKTLADYRKEFSLNKDGDMIKSYKGKGPMVVIPSNIKGKPVKIAENAFKSCDCIQRVEIENGVTEIGAWAFYDCKNLQSVTIPDGVTNISENAFRWCKNLQSITIPDSVTSIGENAFRGCESLQSVDFPESVTSIDKGAFRDCTNLKNITIPKCIKQIGEYVFSNCTNLQDVTIPDSITNIDWTAFFFCPKLTIHAPAGSYAETFATKNFIKFQAI